MSSARHAKFCALHTVYFLLTVLSLGALGAHAQPTPGGADGRVADTKVSAVQSAQTPEQSALVPVSGTQSEQGSADQSSTDSSRLPAELEPEPASKSRLSGGVKINDWLVMILSLGLIVALIFILAWLARRFGGMRAVGIKDMQVLSAMPLGTREKLALVEVKGKQILIGVTQTTISHIHTFSDADLSAHADNAGQHTPQQSEFANKLKQMLSRDNSIEPDSTKPHDL